jgi:hypothetical protein
MSNLARVVAELAKQRNLCSNELRKLDMALSALKGLGGNTGTASQGRSSGRPRRTMSAAGRKRIAAAQRARWAKFKQQQKRAK